MNTLGKKSMSELIGVHPLLSACAYLAVTNMGKYDATVFDGLRTEAEQAALYARGRTKPGNKVTWTMHSNHLTGRSVDIVPYVDGKIMWDSKDPVLQLKVDEAYKEINKQMYKYAKVLGIRIENLYDVVGRDKPHWDIINDNYDARKLKWQ